MIARGLSLDEPAVALAAIAAGGPVSAMRLVDGTQVFNESWIWTAKIARLGVPTTSYENAISVEGDFDQDVVALHLTWFPKGASPVPAANGVSEVLPQDDAKRLAHYAIVELLRNGTSHSRARGAFVCASRFDFESQDAGELVQVSVADGGIGILESLKRMHPGLTDAREALEKSLWPHYSGAFEEGLTGSGENAGLGLFFIAEMTKLIGGRLLIASRGAALLLRGDPDAQDRHTIEFIDAEYAGTLVVFEIPVDRVFDYDSIMEKIRHLAEEQTPKRGAHRWLTFEEPSQPELPRFRIAGTEMAPETRRFAEDQLEPLAFKRQGFVLDFIDVDVATQSWVHALLFEVLRLAWAKRTPIFIINARPAVRSSLELVENYALAG